jgi:hypothetical protein
VFCIGTHAGNRSNFFEGGGRIKSEERQVGHLNQPFRPEMEAPILALGYCSTASSPQLGGCLRSALVEFKRNNLPAHQMHRVKLVRGAPGKVAHMPARAFKSDHAIPPK